jgi:hypothetical protein
MNTEVQEEMKEGNENENLTSLTQQLPGCERSHDDGLCQEGQPDITDDSVT